MKLFKAADVCDIVQVQPYVLRSWEKEFPGIGVQKTPDAARLYRQSDIDQVQRIKQLVFGEGLTLAGARRRMDEESPRVDVTTDELVLPQEAVAAVNAVRQGLRDLLAVLSRDPTGAAGGRSDEEYALQPPPARTARVVERTAKARPVKAARPAAHA